MTPHLGFNVTETGKKLICVLFGERTSNHTLRPMSILDRIWKYPSVDNGGDEGITQWMIKKLMGRHSVLEVTINHPWKITE